MRTEGDAAYALFDTGPPEHPYLYGVHYERRNGLWDETISTNGSGWSRTGGLDETSGTLTMWDEAPTGADRVRVEFDGESREEPVDGSELAVTRRVAQQQIPSRAGDRRAPEQTGPHRVR